MEVCFLFGLSVKQCTQRKEPRRLRTRETKPARLSCCEVTATTERISLRRSSAAMFLVFVDSHYLRAGSIEGLTNSIGIVLQKGVAATVGAERRGDKTTSAGLAKSGH